jgi:hypothetical protein
LDILLFFFLFREAIADCGAMLACGLRIADMRYAEAKSLNQEKINLPRSLFGAISKLYPNSPFHPPLFLFPFFSHLPLQPA